MSRKVNRICHKGFRSMVLRLTDPKVTALIYPSGKIVLVGGKTRRDVQKAASQVCEKLKLKMIGGVKFTNFAGTFNLGHRIKLGVYFKELREHHLPYTGACYYEQEEFPGIIYTPSPNTKTKFLLFESGKVVITGCPRKSLLIESYQEFLINHDLLELKTKGGKQN